uniref:Uncharacterized protein n=1 Tax=Caenorhabditis japonica TaxID=281687 RepID=A0A8R1EU71_CAEJA
MTWMTWMTQIAAIKAERTRQSSRQVNFVTGPTPAAAFDNMAKKTPAAAATEAHAPPPWGGAPADAERPVNGHFGRTWPASRR